MRALVQRVAEASVEIDGAEVGGIGPGLLVLLGVSADDDEADAAYLVAKIVNLRVFADDANRFNLSALDAGAEVLVVSQFTLYADTRRGRRPDFTLAAPPDLAEKLLRTHGGVAARYWPDRSHRSIPGLHAGKVPERWPGNHYAGQRRSPSLEALTPSMGPGPSQTVGSLNAQSGRAPEWLPKRALC
ncbi:D-aminoacyl-tRNA deacylase [Geodia barretti]|uniref:D-aminoacyl-tRNA deacylase n=1 Tax=Geodia barretti TaxID=519541 RepID=A0AA35TCX0_GEOBA|nr:D-aminoacyl-tRNA deacylase [Geodia barretti]